NDTIKSFLNLVKGFNKVNDIKIILELDKDIEVNGYQNELIQSLMNLYNNSKEIMEKRDIVDKYIFINTYVKNNLIIIKFKDSAGGIDTKILPKIFDPYFTTKHQSQGTGLGLHTVYNLIVNDMDGKIEVKNISYKYQNKNLKGVEFKIMFTNKRIDHED
ncbi:MAG: ATP-binding protein, partial [Campylobacterota bacterium]|nr:ATP-binding protein [Campylobacterota bacterium]